MFAVLAQAAGRDKDGNPHPVRPALSAKWWTAARQLVRVRRALRPLLNTCQPTTRYAGRNLAYIGARYPDASPASRKRRLAVQPGLALPGGAGLWLGDYESVTAAQMVMARHNGRDAWPLAVTVRDADAGGGTSAQPQPVRWGRSRRNSQPPRLTIALARALDARQAVGARVARAASNLRAFDRRLADGWQDAARGLQSGALNWRG